ncbi:MAG TPA: class II aldolase/adducin family protein [Candidatus Limnocylindria bacterium]|nr:class II aldolase/adducin family protein [Candidatus Limnocylindria bacterium]
MTRSRAGVLWEHGRAMSPAFAAQPLDLERLRRALVRAGRRLGARGLISASEGNVSVRLDAGTLLVTPSGRRKDELEPQDVLEVGLASDADAWPAMPYGSPGLRPTSDLAIHRAIYAARSDVLAVVHAHLPASMALTLAGETPDPAVLPETALLIPRLPLIPFDPPGSASLAAGVATALAAEPAPFPGAVLLERHGAVAVGAADAGIDDATELRTRAVDQALDRLELVEVLCRTWRDALLIGAAVRGGDGRDILRAPSPRPGTPAGGRGKQP